MKPLGLLLLTIAFAFATPATAEDRRVLRQAPQELVTGRPAQAATGDVAGGRVIPNPILKILADPRIDPNVAYILWQTSRKPTDDWTMNELGFVAQAAPTLVEAGIPFNKIQMLYVFWGLDPSDVFNPSFGPNWQSQSTALDPRGAANVGAISSANCQVNISQMTVATYRACAGGGQY